MNQFKSLKIAFIQSAWHAEIVQQSYAGFLNGLEGQLEASQVTRIEVPGSLEIPLTAQQLARSGQYAVIVCAGLIVDGGIYRHEYVARAVIDGIMRVQLDTSVPVLSIVLTPHNFQDTDSHRDFFLAHFEEKGREAARACLAVLGNQRRIPSAA